MGLAADIVNFFYSETPQDNDASQEKSLGDFFNERIRALGSVDISEALKIIRQPTLQGILLYTGSHQHGKPPLSETYRSWDFNSDLAAYGGYDFLVSGFPEIHTHFSSSVRPVVVKKKDDSEGIGSGFLMHNRSFVTCRHCIEDMQSVSLGGWNSQDIPLSKIWVPVDSRIDLAVLDFEDDPFPGIPGFLLENAQILDNILTMGYPPIPGFDAVLVAEKAQVSGLVSAEHIKSRTTLKSSIGQIVATEKSYLDRQVYLLISARVKGGNSGGPVIGKYGCVAGIVTQLPAGSEGQPDLLGYGAAIPAHILGAMVEACNETGGRTGDGISVEPLRFSMLNEGFCTLT